MQHSQSFIDFNQTPQDFEKLIKESKVPVIVDFHADWCGPCRKLGPVLVEKVESEEHKGKVLLVKVNVDDDEELAESYKISGIPHVILFVGGEAVYTVTGFDENQVK